MQYNMNELLQQHGCANVFNVPEGLKELMSDIAREVLRAQPDKLFDFIANYLSVLIITREHGIMAVKILDDLCDCRPSVTEHLEANGFSSVQAATIAALVQEEIQKTEPDEGNENVKEIQILKKILQSNPIDESKTAKVCQIARNAYREYWYRKQLLAKNLSKWSEEPWEVAAAHTLTIYKKTNPTFSELTRATLKIQAAYRGYHVRRNLLFYKEKPAPKKKLSGPPVDVAGERQIELGRVISLKVEHDEVSQMFKADVRNVLGLPFDTTRMLTHVMDSANECHCDPINPVRSGQRPVPPTPFSSTIQTPSKIIQEPESLSELPRPSLATKIIQEPQSLSELPRHENATKISFAPSQPEVQEVDAQASVSTALSPAKDSDTEAEEVSEAASASATRTEESGVSEEIGVSEGSTVPDAANATDEDVPEGEEEGE